MSGKLRVVKMSGAGNDFLLLGPEEIATLGKDPVEWVRRVCRRGLSVGADGVLLVEPAGGDRVRVRFYNPDGSSVFCGNGSRCAARFANLRGFAGSQMILETAVGEVPAQLVDEGVRLELPPPRDLGTAEIVAAGQRFAGRIVDAGVPHFVVFVEVPADAPLERWGPEVRRHPRFGNEGTNFDLVAYEQDGSLTLRTWERGVEGETLACGSGAVAAAFAARLDGGPERARIVPASGVALQVELPGEAREPKCTLLTGEARLILEGVLHEEAAWDCWAG